MRKGRKIMRKFLATTLIATLLCTLSVPAFAEVRVPDSVSYNGVLPDGTKAVSEMIQREPALDNQKERVLIGYEYVPGYDELRNMVIIPEYAYIWGTSIKFVAGTKPYYKLTSTHTKVSSSEWQLQANLGSKFNIASAKANLTTTGGYKSSQSVTITAGQEWKVDLTDPGEYFLNWYQRAHQYAAYCGANYITTDSNDGKFTKIYIGDALFPANEVHLDVSDEPNI